MSMNNRRIALGLGTGAGALLGAALLSGVASPLAAADPTDVFAVDPVTATDLSTFGALTGDATTNPYDITTLPAFGGLGTDTTETELLANYDTGVDGTSTPVLATGPEAGSETELINIYSNPLFTDTSTDVTAAFSAPGVTENLVSPIGSDSGALASNVGTETDTILLDPSSGLDFGISLESVPSTISGDAPTVTEDLITPLGNFPISDLLGGSDLTSLLGSGDGLGSLLTGGDLLTGLDPFVSLLTSF
ncbi:MAG TPA: hypothetical protein VNW74_22805 [Mycobacterium sp.]|nr:hypothetical protein [Mycobacterium sp.]